MTLVKAASHRDSAGTSHHAPAPLSSVHQPALDGVRGIAILLVLVIHLGVMIPQTPVEHAAFTMMSAGWIGVDLFFVLSGALITGILLDTKRDPHYFRNFYTRRVLRIFPLYFAILIFSFYILPHIPNPKAANFARLEGSELWYWFYLQNFSMAIAGGPRHGIMDVTWSLAIEEQFYLVWPLLVYLLPVKRLTAVCAAILVLGLLLRIAMREAGYAPFAIYVLTPTRLDGLSAGALVAIALRSGIDHRTLTKAAGATLAGGLAATAIVSAIAGGGLPYDDWTVQTFGFTALAVMFAGLVMLTALRAGTSTRLDRVMRSPFLVGFGVLSYGIYLFHLPLRAVLRDTIMKPVSFPDWPGGTLLAQGVFYIAATAVAFAVAWASYHLFEKHFLRLKNTLAPNTREAVAEQRV